MSCILSIFFPVRHISHSPAISQVGIHSLRQFLVLFSSLHSSPSIHHPSHILLPNRYFITSRFHTFDGLVIVIGFFTDVLLHGTLEEVASLVVVLRLWRFFKIIEKFSVGAQEQMDRLEMRISELEEENGRLRRLLGNGKRDEEGDVQAGESELV